MEQNQDLVVALDGTLASEQLCRVVYVSHAAPYVNEAICAQILEISQRNNVKRGITGVLAFYGGRFTQVLEGQHDTLNRLMRTISHDTRHHDVQIVDTAPIQRRSFATWSMNNIPTQSLDLNTKGKLWSLLSKSHAAPSYGHAQIVADLVTYLESLPEPFRNPEDK